MKQAVLAIKFLTLVCSGLLAVEAHAQSSGLAKLLDLALDQHPTVLQAQNQEKSARYDLDAVNWGRYPSLSTELRSDSSFVQSIAKVEQPLWAGGRIEGRIELARNNLNVAQASTEDAKLTAMYQVSGAYIDFLRLREKLVTAEENVLQHKRLAELISRRIAAEISPPADATLAQARLQQALTEKLQIQRQLDTTLNSLSQWVGLVSPAQITPIHVNYVRAPQLELVVQKVMETAAQRRKLLAQIESAKTQIDLAKAQAMPTVVAGYQQIVSGPLTSGMDRGRAYIGLQFQPGAGLSVMPAISSAVSKKEAAEQELLVLERNLIMQVQTVYNDIDLLQAQTQPSGALKEETGLLVESYLRQYQIGRKNWLDVLNALKEKTQAFYNATDVQYSLMQSQVKLMLMSGDIQAGHYSAVNE